MIYVYTYRMYPSLSCCTLFFSLSNETATNETLITTTPKTTTTTKSKDVDLPVKGAAEAEKHSSMTIFFILLVVGKLSTLPMLRLLSSKAQRCKKFGKSSKPCHVGIHSIAPTEYCQMSTHMPGS